MTLNDPINQFYAPLNATLFFVNHPCTVIQSQWMDRWREENLQEIVTSELKRGCKLQHTRLTHVRFNFENVCPHKYRLRGLATS